MTNSVLDHQKNVSWDERIRAESTQYKIRGPVSKSNLEINPHQLWNASRELKDETEYCTKDKGSIKA